MSLLRVAGLVCAKDLRAERRSLAALVSMGVFALLTLVAFHFALDALSDETRRLAPGLLWIALLFASILGLNRSFALEREGGAVQSLLLAPVDRGAIYLGKMAANAILLLLLEAVAFPLLALLYNLPLEQAAPRLAAIAALGALDLAAAGTIFSAIAGLTRMREVLAPLLFLPAATPVVIAAVEGSTYAVEGSSEGFDMALRILAGFFLVYASASYLLFEHVLED